MWSDPILNSSLGFALGMLYLTAFLMFGKNGMLNLIDKHMRCLMLHTSHRGHSAKRPAHVDRLIACLI